MSLGLDLQGNTFWEFRDTLSSHKHRMRRIVQYPSSTHYSEIKISPQWHQWLRHTRPNPPSLTEQSQDIIRQQNLKVLAAEADARWATKPSFLNSPGQPEVQPLSALQGENLGIDSESHDRDSARRPAGGGQPASVVRKVGISTEYEGTAQQEEKHSPEGIRDPSNESLGLGQGKRSRTDQIKDKPNPWNQARGNDKWQPAAWDSSLVSLRR